MSDIVTEAPLSPAAMARSWMPFVLIVLIWGSTWLVITGQLGVVPPSWSVAYRFLIGSATMFVVALVTRTSLRLTPADALMVATVGLCLFGLNFNFVYRAEQHVTSGLVAVVFALLVVPNAILARIFLGQRLGRQLIVGSAVAVAGVSLLFLHEARVDPHGSGEAIAGIALTLAAIVAASCANVLQATNTAKRYPMFSTLSVAMLLGAAMDAAWAWTTTGPPEFEPTFTYVAGVLYLGLFASALAFPLYFGVLRVIGPAKAAYSSVIVPVIAMLLSTIFENYRWSLLAGIGAALAGVGLVIALSARRPTR